jgi:hypothetical protein
LGGQAGLESTLCICKAHYIHATMHIMCAGNSEHSQKRKLC